MGIQPLIMPGWGTRARSTGASSSSNWYRGVTPVVVQEEKDGLKPWKREYDARFSTMTSLGRMHSHVAEHVEQCHRTHAEKLDIFQKHELPNLTWTDLNKLTHDRSLRSRQPCYYGDVGGPPRLP